MVLLSFYALVGPMPWSIGRSDVYHFLFHSIFFGSENNLPFIIFTFKRHIIFLFQTLKAHIENKILLPEKTNNQLKRTAQVD